MLRTDAVAGARPTGRASDATDTGPEAVVRRQDIVGLRPRQTLCGPRVDQDLRPLTGLDGESRYSRRPLPAGVVPALPPHSTEISMARHATTQAVALAAASTNLRVAIYIRRSTDEEHQPFSLEAQDSKLRAYIKSQPNWSLVATFPDDASASSLERDGLQRALAAARAGRFDVLLVYRVDRFTRRIRDLVTLLDELDGAGVVFRSATEPFGTSTPAGRMLVQMLGVFAEFEREMIIDRVINGMERKASKGQWTVGAVPYGYTRNSEHSLVTLDDEITIVKLIFRLYTRRRLGCRAIAAHLNERN